MQKFTNDYSKIRLLYLQTSHHKNILDTLVDSIKVYTSGMTISSVLHHRNYDTLILDMTHPESMDVLKNIKQTFPQRFVIACCKDANLIKDALINGADSVLIDTMNQEECEKTLYKVCTYINMQEIFHERYYTDQLTLCKNIYALEEDIELTDGNALMKISLHSFSDFKVYYGVDITNKVLVEFGNAIKINLPINAVLYRSQDDEFSILIHNPSPSQEKILSHQVKSFFEQTPIEVDGFLIKIITSIGVSLGEDLIQKADIALSEAKEGSRIAFYKDDSNFLKEQHQHIRWVKVIQEALSEDRIRTHYQPILNNENNTITKYEVLCRIEGEGEDLFQPHEFIPAAIIAGRMCDITRVVIDKSFKYFKNSDFCFSINITKEDFMAEYLVEFISYKCDYYNIKPQRIYIEILENISTEATNDCLCQIKSLQAFGCNISIDDFGVDSSNFSRMMQIKAEVLKIDGHFIQHLLDDKNARIIVENIVDFSKKIGAKTVAEYVDSEELYELVKDMGISYCQGFYIGKPQKDIL
ncbi:EAL domain-containing protein [Sulfurimonas sp. MAG313]|nr:GGDEF domain-containing phosphodiesterase [Sulfurimonas sp. MAG313]MDF1881279.1 EAL domain-containing protein [Sulfurimonas sp. MAG313]